jgi:group I intron endonuclease
MRTIWSNRLKNIQPEKRYVVYSIQNNTNKKIYLGYTENYTRRMREHKNMAKKKRLPKVNLLHRDMKELGFDSFEFKKIKEFQTMQEAIDHEKELLNQYESDQLYNKQKYNKGTWKSGYSKPISAEENKQRMLDKIIGGIIDVQLKINLLILERQ